MAVTFNGADLTVRFKELATNGAELQYQVEYDCAAGTVSHFVDASKPQSTDADGMRVYKDTLTYAENLSAGLTRSPRVRMRTQNAKGKWSNWSAVDAQNPIPVLPHPPVITPTLTGVEVTLGLPLDTDLEGFVAWVGTTPDFSLDGSNERYRGKASTFALQLPDEDEYYLRVAPYDAFGLDLFSTWDAQPIKRRPLDDALTGSAPWKQLPSFVGSYLSKPIDDLAALQIRYGSSVLSASKALSDKNHVAIQDLRLYVDKNGALVAESLTQLTSRVGDAEETMEAGFLEVNRTIADKEHALSESITDQIAQYGQTVTAALNEERRVSVTEKEALAETIEELAGTVRDGDEELNGQINNVRELVITKDDAMGTRVDELGVKIETEVEGEKLAREAAIQTVEKAIADGDKAQAQRIDTLSSSVNGIIAPGGQLETINGIIQTIQETEADNNSARAEEVKTLQSRLDNVNGASLEQSFKTVSDDVAGVKSEYTLKVQNDINGNKYVAGYGLAMQNGVSELTFAIDSFRFLTPGENPRQLLYGDGNGGIYMPDVTVDRLKAGTIDFEFINKQSLQNPTGGYQVLPGGFTIMWGQYRGTIRDEVSVNIVFPRPFATALMSITATPYITGNNNLKDLWLQSTSNRSNTGATFYTQAARDDAQSLDGFDWMAFGY